MGLCICSSYSLSFLDVRQYYNTSLSRLLFCRFRLWPKIIASRIISAVFMQSNLHGHCYSQHLWCVYPCVTELWTFNVNPSLWLQPLPVQIYVDQSEVCAAVVTISTKSQIRFCTRDPQIPEMQSKVSYFCCKLCWSLFDSSSRNNENTIFMNKFAFLSSCF